jgi:hypothetical protein
LETADQAGKAMSGIGNAVEVLDPVRLAGVHIGPSQDPLSTRRPSGEGTSA